VIAAALDSLLNAGASAPQAALPENTRMLATQRGELRVHDSGGAGPVLLMVPDGPNVIEHHAAVIARLAPHARVICFDMPGFGYSRPALGYDHGLRAGAEAVLAVMDALDVKEAALHFSCANGFYAMAAAKLAPQRIRRLLLCQTPALQSMPAWTLRNVPRAIRTPVLGQLMMRGARRKFAHSWYGMAMPDKQQRAAFRATADHALTHGGCFCLAGVVQGLGRAQEQELRGIRQPVTLLWGDADRSHRYTRAESLQSLVPQAQIQHFPDCGHFPDLERPQQYAEIALSALSA
jgi:pimeloyl-ACP methyl ester carboxylesterase